MAYHPLTRDSGGTPEDRRSEASRILKMFVESGFDLDELAPNERRFMDQMLDNELQPISTKQLFWLRDLKEKLL
jgi:hypothetical protein